MQIPGESYFLARHRKNVLFRPYRRAVRCASGAYDEFDQPLGGLRYDMGRRNCQIWTLLLAESSAVGLCTLASRSPRWNTTELSHHSPTGRHYEDVVNILSVSPPAGFLPQLFSNRYDNLTALVEPLATSRAEALVLQPGLFVDVEYPVPYLLALGEIQISNYTCASLRLGEIPFIVHSPGTTNGKPNPITPCPTLDYNICGAQMAGAPGWKHQLGAKLTTV